MHKPIEEGSKIISFDPSPVLSGDRIHEWIGARYSPMEEYASDLFRIVRQMHIVQQLITNKKHVPYSTDGIRGLTSDHYAVLCTIDESFTFHCYNLVKREIIRTAKGNMDVFIPDPTNIGYRRTMMRYQSLFR